MRLFFAILFIIPSFSILGQTRLELTMRHGGITRDYILYVPTIYNPSLPTPLVLNLHGYSSNNWQQEFYGDFRPVADTANFILVQPNGTPDPLNPSNLHWNARWGSTVDDVGFLSALIDTIDLTYNINLDAVYSTGMSNGGFMSHTLACELNNRITAIASVTGSMSMAQYNNCNPNSPVPAMQIHGTNDPTVPYIGNALMAPIDSVVAFWVRENGCDPSPSVTQVPNTNLTDLCTATRYDYLNGTNGAKVAFYKILGGTHTWPGATINLGVTNMDFNASVEIWRFFRQYRKSRLVNTASITQNSNISIAPNPSSQSFRVDSEGGVAEYALFDMFGRMVVVGKPNAISANLDVYDLPNGLYLLELTTFAGDKSTHKLVKN